MLIQYLLFRFKTFCEECIDESEWFSTICGLSLIIGIIIFIIAIWIKAMLMLLLGAAIILGSMFLSVNEDKIKDWIKIQKSNYEVFRDLKKEEEE